MPSKKKKYNARFPPARIKKIMQMDDEVGKVAAPVPVIISRALELFVEALIDKSRELMQSRNTRTLTAGHMKHVIVSEKKYSFLAELVRNVADVPVNDPEDSVKPVLQRQQLLNTPKEMSKTTGSAAAERRPRGRPKKQTTGGEVLPSGKRGRQKLLDSEKPPKRRRKKKELETVSDIDPDCEQYQEDSLQEIVVAASHDTASSGENSSSFPDGSVSDEKDGDAVTTIAMHNGHRQQQQLNKVTVEQIDSDHQALNLLTPGSVMTDGIAPECVSVMHKFPTEIPHQHLMATMHNSQLTASTSQQPPVLQIQPNATRLSIATQQPTVDKNQTCFATHRMPPVLSHVLPSPRLLTSPPTLPITVCTQYDTRNNNSMSSPELGRSNTSK